MNTLLNNPSINDENLILSEQKENQNININNLIIEKKILNLMENPIYLLLEFLIS